MLYLYLNLLPLSECVCSLIYRLFFRTSVAPVVIDTINLSFSLLFTPSDRAAPSLHLTRPKALKDSPPHTEAVLAGPGGTSITYLLCIDYT